MSDLSLRLMREEDIEPASRIIIKAHEWYHDLSLYPEILEKDCMPRLRESMKHSLEKGEIYVLGFRNSDLVSVYQLPYFSKNGNLLESVGDGYFATEPEGQGIGSEYLGRLESILSKTAFSADAESLLHKVITRRKSPLYERLGYRLTETRDDMRWMHYHYERMYQATNLELPEQEEKIVQTLGLRVLIYSR